MFQIKQINNKFIVKQNKRIIMEYNSWQKSIELCMLRCHKIFTDNNLKIIKIPFIKFWLVW